MKTLLKNYYYEMISSFPFIHLSRELDYVLELQDQERVQLQQLLHGHSLHARPCQVDQEQEL